MQRPRNTALMVAMWLNALFGIALLAGGGWLITLGGSWYYAIAGIAMLVTAFLLFRRNPSALWLYAALVLGTLIWALWEAGLDWWPLAARGDVLFLLGLFMVTPWVTRPLFQQPTGTADIDRTRTPRQAKMPLMASLLLFLLVGIASWFVDPHRQEGTVSAQPVQAATDALGVPLEEWHAYGRTNFGQRYSPLDQITPDNVTELEVAWHYETGDMRGRPGDPVETTFEVTPLKIGDRLYLCTPHQSVIALNATTGEEIWRYDPQIRDELALQHLTCRGLSYYDPAKAAMVAPPASASGGEQAPDGPGPAESGTDTATATETTTETSVAADGSQPGSDNEEIGREGADGSGQAGGSVDPSGEDTLAELNIPVAAEDGPTTDTCDAKLFMPTADGRVIALNPEDGAVCRSFGNGTGQINLWANMPHPRAGGYYSTSPVVVTSSLIIVGGTVLDNVSTEEPAGVIRAFDVNTGELVWNWDPAQPEDTAPVEAGETYTPTTPNSWSISSADEALGMVYVPMGNQPPDQWGGDRSGP